MSANWHLKGPLAHGVTAGFAGTTTMTITTTIEQLLRPGLDHPIDYDASDVPVTAAARVLGVHPQTECQRRALFSLVHWGYGSLVGTGQVLLLRRARSAPVATVVFYAAVQTMAFVLLPALGGTPPPWRWRRDMLFTSVAQHGVYAAATGAAAYSMSLRT